MDDPDIMNWELSWGTDQKGCRSLVGVPFPLGKTGV